MRIHVADIRTHNHVLSVTALDGGEVLGSYRLLLEDHRAALLDLWVSEDYRQRGIATKLVRLAVDQAKRYGKESLVAWANISNSAATGLLRKSGFFVCGRDSDDDLFFCHPLNQLHDFHPLRLPVSVRG